MQAKQFQPKVVVAGVHKNPLGVLLPRSKFSGYPQPSLFERLIHNLRQTQPIRKLRQAQLEILQGFREAPRGIK